MSPLCHHLALNTERGYALITAIVFLVILSTVGVITLRNTGLEIRMNANNNRQTEAFEAAELARTLTAQLLEPHLRTRGWPASAGGLIPDARFAHAIPKGMTLGKNSEGTAPASWHEVEMSDSSDFNPLDMSTIAAHYYSNVAAKESKDFIVQAAVSVKKLHVDMNPGNGVAMASGYQGLGQSAAKGGSNLYLNITAHGKDPFSQASSFTSSDYRYVIRN